MKKILWIAIICLFAAIRMIGNTAAQENIKAAAEPAVIFENGNMILYSGAPEGKIKVVLEREKLLKGRLLCVSPGQRLPSDFEAPQVRNVKKLVGNYFDCQENVALTEDTIGALCAMRQEGLLEKVRLTEGAVSFYQQEEKRKEALSRYLKVYPWEEAVKQAFYHVPGGGESEHQTGRAVDICLTGAVQVGKKDPLLQSREGEKLMKNMARFGFIRRYGAEKKNREEGNCEQLHLRYVGHPHACVMEETGRTLEEYLLFVSTQGAVTVTMDREVYYIYSIPFHENRKEIYLPCQPAQMSLDNLGNAVVVCKKAS